MTEQLQNDASGLRVLVVDDDEAVRVTLAANLELDGFEVTEAENGQQALDFLAENEVELVLSDIRMPQMTGVEMAERIRELHPELPVVLMTAYTADTDIEYVIQHGVFTVLGKPFDVLPVDRSAIPVEQAGPRQVERSGAHRADRRAVTSALAQPAKRGLVGKTFGVNAGANDWDSDVAREMQPEQAVRNLFRLGGLLEDPPLSLEVTSPEGTRLSTTP